MRFPHFIRSSFFLPVIFLGAALFCYLFVDFSLIEKLAPYRKEIRTWAKGASLLIFPPFYLALSIGGFLLARFQWRSGRWTLPLFEIAAAQCLSVACVRIFKFMIGRVRPEAFLSKGLVGFECFSSSHHFHSFPSGHTMAAFALTGSLLLLFPRFRFLWLFLAFSLSLSRVFLLDHFPSDLFATAATGLLIAQGVHGATKQIIHHTTGEDFS